MHLNFKKFALVVLLPILNSFGYSAEIMMASLCYKQEPASIALAEIGSRLPVKVVIELRKAHYVTGDYANLGTLPAFLKACADSSLNVFWDEEKRLIWVSDCLPGDSTGRIQPLKIVNLPKELLLAGG